MSQINALDGSNFSSTSIRSQSTAQNKDTQVSFQTYLDKTQSGTSISTKELNSIFQTAADTYGVDVDLLKAVAKAESNFTANATSSAGAMGIMQLMPSTASSLGVTDAYDPEQNIMGGAKLLASHLKKYDGNVSLALAAYNCGSSAVDSYGGVPPYKETQNYIVKVLNYYDSGVDAPAFSNYTTNINETTMTAKQLQELQKEAAITKELEDITYNDIYVTSNTEETLSAASTDTSTASVTASDTIEKEYSYEDYIDFVSDYISLVSGKNTDSSSPSLTSSLLQNSSSSSDLLASSLLQNGSFSSNLLASSLLQNYTAASSSYNNNIINLLQSTLVTASDEE